MTDGWSRRRFFRTVGAVGCATMAGCQSVPFHGGSLSLSMDETSDQLIADRAVLDWTDEEREIFLDALENGSTTVSHSRYPPLRSFYPVEYDGQYYEITHTVTGSHEATAVDAKIDFEPETTEGPSIAFDDLPERDRRLLERPVTFEPKPQTDGWDWSVEGVYRPAEVEASVLVPDQQYDFVTDDGTAYRVRVSHRPTTIEDYRYTVDRIAPDVASFAEYVRDKYLFALPTLSQAERKIVETAIRTRGYTRGTDSDERVAYRSLCEQFRRHDAIKGVSVDPNNGFGEYLVRYEQTVYWAEVTFYANGTTTVENRRSAERVGATR